MSEKEKKVVEKICKLPPELLDKFVDKLDGAAMAVEYLNKNEENKEGKE